MRRSKVFTGVALFLLTALLLNGIPWTPDLEDPSLSTGITEPSVTDPSTEPTQEPTETVPTEPDAPTVPTEPEEPEKPAYTGPEPKDSDLVRVADFIPSVVQDLSYASTNNFTKKTIYNFSDAFLRYGTVKKLIEVCKDLKEFGYALKIWDAFRPVSAQQALWNVCPDPNYVSHPTKGNRSHCRGSAVDVTLVNLETGEELAMPTGFDDFTALADRDYSDCDPDVALRAIQLQNIMKKHGMVPYDKEWWHFSDSKEYPVEETLTFVKPSRWTAEVSKNLSMRLRPDTKASTILKIPKNGVVKLLGYYKSYALVEYKGLCGYVQAVYLRPAPEAAWLPKCNNYVTMWKNSVTSIAVDRIQVGEEMTVAGWDYKFALVYFEGKRGFVSLKYMQPKDSNCLSNYLSIVKPTAEYTHKQMVKDMKAICKKYPNLATLGSIGKSELGRDLPVLRIGREDAKYHVLLQGAIHGREHMTAWLLTAMAEFWLENNIGLYGDVCYHIIPMVNPDGVTISQTGRLNATQTAIYERDKAQKITGLSVWNYAVTWKANGLGIDLNRNFPATWELIGDRTEPSSSMYKGEEPFSAAETRALRDYTYQYDFDATVSYHASGSIIYYEYGDMEPVNSLSKSLANAISNNTGYPLRVEESGSKGGYKDWVMGELGIPSVTIEIGFQQCPLSKSEIYSVFFRNLSVMPDIAQWLQ